MRRSSQLLLILPLLGACATFVPPVTPEDAGGDPALLEQLRAGRGIYVRKCARCHALRPVDGYDDADWHRQVWKMMTVEKVKLKEPDRAKLILYLTTMNDRD